VAASEPSGRRSPAGLFYREQGSGTNVVLCVHGFCQSSFYWAPSLAHLAAAGVRAVAPDLPGFGASAAMSGPYTMEGYADVLAQLLDHLEVERVTLVGGSMGGVVAQHLALRHGERLVRLLLVATGAAPGNSAAALAKADALASEVPWTDQTVQGIVNGFFFRAPTDQVLKELQAIVRAASPQAAAQALRSNALSNTLDSLGRVGVPTWIVQGRHDPSRTPERGAVIRDSIHGAQLLVMEGSGHTPQLEEPDGFHAAVLPFLLGQVRP